MSRAVRLVAGVAVCSLTAIALVLFLRDASDLRNAALVLCFIAVIATAILAGRLAAALGALFASIVFAVWLFPPIGSLAVNEPEGQISLTAFFILSTAVCAIARPIRDRAR